MADLVPHYDHVREERVLIDVNVRSEADDAAIGISLGAGCAEETWRRGTRCHKFFFGQKMYLKFAGIGVIVFRWRQSEARSRELGFGLRKSGDGPKHGKHEHRGGSLPRVLSHNPAIGGILS
jgi:hypothetical protein